MCRLTGRCLGDIDELHRPFNQNGRSQSHFVMRKISRGRRPKGAIDIRATKTQAIIHGALVTILSGAPRKAVQTTIRDRFRKECIRAAKRGGGNFMATSLLLNSTVSSHIAQLLPPTDQAQHIDRLARVIREFLINLDLPMANAKAVRTFSAVSFDMLASPIDFVVLGRVFVRSSRWCRMHAISTAMYPQIGFASRAMTACTRQMRAAMVRTPLCTRAATSSSIHRTSRASHSRCRHSNSRCNNATDVPCDLLLRRLGRLVEQADARRIHHPAPIFCLDMAVLVCEMHPVVLFINRFGSSVGRARDF